MLRQLLEHLFILKCSPLFSLHNKKLNKTEINVCNRNGEQDMIFGRLKIDRL